MFSFIGFADQDLRFVSPDLGLKDLEQSPIQSAQIWGVCG